MGWLKKVTGAVLSPVTTVAKATGLKDPVTKAVMKAEGIHQGLATMPLNKLMGGGGGAAGAAGGADAGPQEPQRSAWRDQRMGINYGSINPRPQNRMPMSWMLGPTRMDQPWQNLEALKIGPSSMRMAPPQQGTVAGQYPGQTINWQRQQVQQQPYQQTMPMGMFFPRSGGFFGRNRGRSF